jgi:hypothetical protein
MMKRTKFCRECEIVKPIEEFLMKNGERRICRDCFIKLNSHHPRGFQKTKPVTFINPITDS